MAGIIPGRGFKTSRLQRFGYARLTASRDNILCAAGEVIPGHEFHYWDTTAPGDAMTAAKNDGRQWPCVVANENLFAGFPHLYLYGKRPPKAADEGLPSKRAKMFSIIVPQPSSGLRLL